MCYNRRAVHYQEKRMKRLVIGLVVVIVAVAAVVLWRTGSGGAPDQTDGDIRRTMVKRGDLSISVTATGSIVPREEARLNFDLPGKVVDVLVEVGDRVEKGSVLARLDDTTLALNARQAEAALSAARAQLEELAAGPRAEEIAAAQANLSAAQAALDGALANLEELKAGPDENQLAAADANLRAAEASLWLASIQKDQVAGGPSAAEIAAAEAQVASALVQQKVARDTHDRTLGCRTVTLPDGQEQEVCPALGTPEEQARYNLHAADESLAAAQAQLDQLTGGPTQEQLDVAQANVSVAAAQRDAAQAQFDQLKAGSSSWQIKVAEANVAGMRAQRDAAQAQLDLSLTGASPQQIAVAQASVDQAQVALEIAQAELSKVELLAPFSGIVTEVNLQSAQPAPATLPAITLADDAELRITVDVDEMDVARVMDDRPVQVSVDPLPDEVVTGRVARIAPSATQMGGVVVYEVTIVLDDTDVPLRSGMSATAHILVEQVQNVLLVPNWAIRIDRDTGKTYVNVVVGDTVREVEIQVGSRGEDMSQVLTGLTEGDEVVAGDVAGLRTLLERGD
jgi:HlyD family secretion protein